MPLRQNPGFWLLMTGQGVSIFGDILYTVAVLSFTYTETGSVIGTSSIMIVGLLARLFAGFVTVQFMDRLPHKRFMVLADIARGAAVALLGVVSLRGEMGLPAIYGVAIINAFAGAFFTPARSAILPAIVMREDLVRANGLIAAVVQTVQAGTWALGAALVAFTGTTAAILINAASFLLSALVTALIAVPPGQETSPPVQRETPLDRMRAGWDQVWSNRVVRDVTIMDAIENFANVIWTSSLMLAFTVEALGAGEEWWGYQGSAYFVGTIIGGVVAAAATRLLTRWAGWTIAFSSGSFALLTAWYALNGNAALAVVLSVLFGPVYQVRDVVQSSMLQASLDPRAIGRAFATREMLLTTLYAPAMVIISLLADLAGAQTAYLLGAGLYAVVAVFAATSLPIRTYKMLPRSA